jgi:predicted metal-dependent hydrolase
MAVKVERFLVRRMKSRWGSCTPRTRRIRLNTELAKKSPELLEYVVVHEMVHLIERQHNDRFKGLMDRHLPNWRDLRKALNHAPPTLWFAPED